MGRKSKLLAALDAHKGRDYYQEKQHKLQKAAEKRKQQKHKGEDEEDTDDEVKLEKAKKNVEDREKHAGPVDKKTEESKKAAEEEEEQSSEGSDNDEGESKTAEDKQDQGEGEAEKSEEEDEDEDDEEDEDDIPLSDLEEEDTTDVVPHQRLTINNSAAIRASLKRISFLTPQTAFSEHNSLVSKQQLDVPDVHDDLQRELQFYSVCQNATKEARSLLKKEGVPFSRPGDYFAEMVKSDEHMSKIKKKLFEEAAAKKASAEAKRQRDLKKFGKQVQVAKLQQRAKEKKEMLEKVNNLKRKRNIGGTTGPTDSSDLFDVALEEANKPEKKRPGSATNHKRQKKDEKYGFGGKKRHAKSTDAKSSADMSGFSVGKMKGKGGKKGSSGASKRPGKARRASQRH